MRAHDSSHTPARIDSVSVDTDSRELRSASIHLLNSSARPEKHRSAVRSTPASPTTQNEMAELLADIDSLPILVRFLIKDILAEMRSDFVSSDADIRSLLLSTLEKMADRMRGSSVRRDTPSDQSPAIVELRSIEYSLVDLPALLNETVLRVGPLELDLLDRTAKRGDRRIDLRPREFQLLKYMMQQSDKSLTRATLLKEVWLYRSVPETNLVDVHMGKLRRKVDGPNEDPMIRNVRGVGFVLSESSCSQSSPSRADERSQNLIIADKSPQSVEQAVQ